MRTAAKPAAAKPASTLALTPRAKKPVGVCTAARVFELEPIFPLAFSVDSPAGREDCGRRGDCGAPRRDLGSDM